MAVLFKKVTRTSDPSDKNSPKKTYPQITYQYSNSATLDEIAKEISGNAGVSEGETISVLKDFRTQLKKQLIAGRTVNIDGLGTFYLAAQSKGTDRSEDFSATDITGLRICFRANSEIRLSTNISTRTDGLVLKDVDRINTDSNDPDSGDHGEDPTV